MSKVRDVLRALAIFHWIVGVLTALLAIVPSAIFAAALSTVLAEERREPAALLVFSIFVAFVAGLALFGVAYAAAMAWAGRSLWHQRHWTFCLVMAGVTCLWFPFGTILGVLTVVYLLQDGVRESFEVALDPSDE